MEALVKMEAYKKEFIEFMVESDVLKFGEFTLKTCIHKKRRFSSALQRKLSEFQHITFHHKFNKFLLVTFHISKPPYLQVFFLPDNQFYFTIRKWIFQKIFYKHSN